jgi:hypothetical protein
MTSKKLLLAGLVAALGLAGSVQAATVHVTPAITGVLNADFTPVDPALILGPGLLAPRAEPYYLQVDITAMTEGLGGAAVGFANTAFGVNIAGDGTAYSDLSLGTTAWTADSTQVDINGNAAGGKVNKWDINSDDGADKNDLQAIILAGVTKNFGPAQFDTRRTLTQGAGDYAGSLYIVLPGTAGATTSATTVLDFGASTYNADGVASTAGNTAVGGSTETYQVQVPEPSTLALLGLGSVLLAFARKRS